LFSDNYETQIQFWAELIPIQPFKEEAQTAIFKDPVRTAL